MNIVSYCKRCNKKYISWHGGREFEGFCSSFCEVISQFSAHPIVWTVWCAFIGYLLYKFILDLFPPLS